MQSISINILLALNEPSLRKFLPDVEPGGMVLYNSDTLPPDCVRNDLRIIARHFSGLADKLGDPKVGNVVMLGALLEATELLDEAQNVAAMRRKVKSQKWFDLDVTALARGRSELRQPLEPCSGREIPLPV